MYQQASPRNLTSMPSMSVRSANTNAENRAKVGDYIHIVGNDLHFDPEDARSGVFFVDGSVARSPQYEVVSPDLVVAKVPEGLSSGPYLLRLRKPESQGLYTEIGAPSVFIVE